MKKILFVIGYEGQQFEDLSQPLLTELEPFVVGAYELSTVSTADLVFSSAGEGFSITSGPDGSDLADFDMVLFRNSTVSYAYHRMAVCALYLQHKGVAYADTVRANAGRGGKLADAVVCWMAGLPTPRLIQASQANLRRLFASDDGPLTYPFVLKGLYGRKGLNNFLIHDYQELLATLDANPHISFVAQEFIKNEGDYRFMVYGDKIGLVFKRQGSGETHLNNISQGGHGELVEVSSFSEEVRRDVLAAARAKGLQIAGVDLIFDVGSGQHYILEINMSPQLATGVFPAEHMRAFVDFLDSQTQKPQVIDIEKIA